MLHRVVAVLALMLVTGCSSEPEPVRHQIAAFGTRVVVTVRASEGVDSEQAVATVDRELQRMHRRWHAWEPGLLMDINRALTEHRSIDLPPEAIKIVERSRELEKLSGGLFNPAIGRLLTL